MKNQQQHRGRHQSDTALFDAEALTHLRVALDELCWLLSRGYTETSALKLVGDRHTLTKRQRMALRRSACTAEQLTLRLPKQCHSLAGETIGVDGFNCIITFEAMLSAGPILRGRDGVRRDIASVHGSYRRVQETDAAIDAIAKLLQPAAAVTWFLDRPVSNSGKLAERIRTKAALDALPWTVEVVNNPDRELAELRDAIVATSDSWILDNAQRWVDLSSMFQPETLWLLDLCTPA
tara:strand:- start:3806 stop:4513 length:708 start_codon:yes stop_codon:yes gene_type:complete